jgi:hypothetical protein
MPEPDTPAVLRHHVLSDPTGRRRHRLAIAGRAVTTLLGLWLLVLVLGGLGLQPLAGLPIVRTLGGRQAAPPALPERVQAAVNRHTTVAPATEVARPSSRTAPIPPRRTAVRAPSRAKKRALAPATPHVRPKTATGLVPTAPAPPISTTNPSVTAPGKALTPPGKTKTEPGPPTTTPGTTPGTNGNRDTTRTTPTPQVTTP